MNIKKEEIRSYFFKNVQFFNEELDGAIIGKDNNGKAVYSWDKMVACYQEAHKCDREEAIETLYYTAGIQSAAGGDAPTICYEF